MRCSTCKNCVSAIKNGHIECVETFNYKKSKSAVEAAVRHKQREIYNFFKRSGCPRSFGEELYGCAENNWNAEFFSMLHIPMPDHESQTRHLRASVYACIMHGDYRMLSDCIDFHGVNTFNDAFASNVEIKLAIREAIVSKDTQKISKMYHMFSFRSADWSPSDFDDAIDTGDIGVLRRVITEWRHSTCGLMGVRNELKLATIKHNRLDMLRILDQDIHGYPTQMMNEMKLSTIARSRLDMLKVLDACIDGYPAEMMHQMRTTRGKTTAIRKEMIAYVMSRQRVANETVNPIENTVDRVTNLQKVLAVIEDCDIPEGKYLELCNLLMDIHRRGVIA